MIYTGAGRNVPAAVDGLASRRINYDDRLAPPHVTDGWHQDRWTLALGRESPGEPEPGGPARTAEDLVHDYEFTDPSILRAAFRHPSDLVGRDMLLEGRFLRFRFLLGVRVTEKFDELRSGPGGPERVVGWSYQTLDGHLEQGRLTYEIAKDLTSGEVEFRIDAYSRQAPIRNPLFRLGFRLFGRRTQKRFYRAALSRLRGRITDPPPRPRPDPDGLVHVPTGTVNGRFERFTVRVLHPGA